MSWESPRLSPARFDIPGDAEAFFSGSRTNFGNHCFDQGTGRALMAQQYQLLYRPVLP
jgi:hypothetical protein